MARIPVNLRLVADAIDVSYESLLALNPELRHGITPPGMAYRLRIPTGKRDRLVSMLRGIPPNRLATWRMITAREDDTFTMIARQTNVSEKVLVAVNKGVLEPGDKVIPSIGRWP